MLANGFRKVRLRAMAHAAISNSTVMLPATDARSSVARRYHDIAAAITNDQGGPSRLSKARMQLILRFAAASVVAELMEAQAVRGEKIDTGLHAALVRTACRVAVRIGLDRSPRAAPRNVTEYLELNKE